VSDAHQLVGLAVLVTAAVAAVWGGLAYFRRRDPGRPLGHALALVQTLLIAQVAIGLLLVSDDRRAPDELHYAYGTLSLLAALTPWLYAPAEPRRRLAWFVGSTLLAGALATRAYLTSG
jgi:heme A synthase